jgi:hypothetical protein
MRGVKWFGERKKKENLNKLKDTEEKTIRREKELSS